MFLYIIHRKFKYIKRKGDIIPFGFIWCLLIFLSIQIWSWPFKLRIVGSSIITGVLLYEVNFGLRENKILSELGDISYSLYLSHAIVMLFLINFKDFIPLYEKPGFSKFSFIIALSLFLSFFIYKYIETHSLISENNIQKIFKPTLTYSE